MKNNRKKPPGGAFYDKLNQFASSPPERQARQTTMMKLVMLCPVNIGEYDMPFAERHVHLGQGDEQGRRLIDRFLAAHGAELTEEERREADLFEQCWFSLFAVSEDRDDLRFEDLLLGGWHRVPRTASTARLGQGFVALCWLRPEGAGAQYMGNCELVPAREREFLVRETRRMMEMARSRFPGHSDRALLRELSWSLHAVIQGLARGMTRLDGATP